MSTTTSSRGAVGRPLGSGNSWDPGIVSHTPARYRGSCRGIDSVCPTTTVARASAHALRILPRIRRCFHSFLFDFVCLCARNCYHSDSQICLIILHSSRHTVHPTRHHVVSHLESHNLLRLRQFQCGLRECSRARRVLGGRLVVRIVRRVRGGGQSSQRMHFRGLQHMRLCARSS